jgi:hypothetical protein
VIKKKPPTTKLINLKQKRLLMVPLKFAELQKADVGK